MLLHQLVEIIPFAAQRGLQQPIAGIAVGDLAAGFVVQSFQPLDKLHDRLRLADGVQRDAEQAERFAHVGQAAGHVQRLADGDVRQRRLQGGQQFAQALFEPNGATGGVQRQRGEDMFGHGGVAHHAVDGEGGILRQIGQAGAGGGAELFGVKQGDGAAGFATPLPAGQQLFGEGAGSAPV